MKKFFEIIPELYKSAYPYSSRHRSDLKEPDFAKAFTEREQSWILAWFEVIPYQYEVHSELDMEFFNLIRKDIMDKYVNNITWLTPKLKKMKDNH